MHQRHWRKVCAEQHAEIERLKAGLMNLALTWIDPGTGAHLMRDEARTLLDPGYPRSGSLNWDLLQEQHNAKLHGEDEEETNGI